jgi:hypothetical protein
MMYRQLAKAGIELMTHPTVDHVLDLIEQLPEDDRLLLEKRLSERLEADWQEAVAENGRIAEERSITEETINRAIHRRRYGERKSYSTRTLTSPRPPHRRLPF